MMNTFSVATARRFQTAFLRRAFSHKSLPESEEIVTSWNKAKKRGREATVQRCIKGDVGLQYFLQRVYTTAGAGITTTLAVPVVTTWIAPQFVESATPAMFLLGAAAGLGGSIGLGFTTYTLNKARTVSYNSVPRQISFVSLIGGMSVMLTPFVQMVQEISPTIWPTAAVLSTVTMGAATMWARSRPVDSLLSWQTPLYGGLVALIANGLVALGAQILFPASGVGAILHSIDVYGGIALFTALTAYETHAAVAMYRNGDPDHLGCAANVYLDFVNLLIRIADALAQAKKKD